MNIRCRKNSRRESFIFSIFVLFGIFLAVAITFIWIVEAYSFDYSEIVKPNELDQKVCQDVKNAVNGFQQVNIKSARNSARQFSDPSSITITPDEQGKTTINYSNTSAEYSVDNNEQTKKRQLYYFFSFSMPERELEQALHDAINLGEKNEDVILVLRGLVKNDFKVTIKAFHDLKESTGLFDVDFPVELNPELFQEYAIEKVPTVVYLSEDGAGRISGVSIPYAFSRFSEELKDYGKYGNTYPVEEDDLLQLIQTRIKLPEYQNKMKKMLSKIGKNIYNLNKYDGYFSKAEEDTTYYINPELVLEEDIVDHKGNVLFSKGTVFNPADYVPLTGKYIFIDGKDNDQVLYALAGDFRKIILTSGDLLELSKKHRHRFYFINDSLIERFQIKRVPSILEQEGRLLRVSEKSIN